MFEKGQLVKHKETGAVFKFDRALDDHKFLAGFITQTGIRCRQVLDQRLFEPLTEEEEREFLSKL